LRFLSGYASLDTSRRRKVNRVKWNDIPFTDAEPETLALEFDLQCEENVREATTEETDK